MQYRRKGNETGDEEHPASSRKQTVAHRAMASARTQLYTMLISKRKGTCEQTLAIPRDVVNGLFSKRKR